MFLRIDDSAIGWFSPIGQTDTMKRHEIMQNLLSFFFVVKEES